MRRKLRAGRVTAIAVLLAALVSGGCGSDSDTKSSSDEYQIGFAAGMTGFLSFYDPAAVKGMTAAIDDVNARDLAGGKKFKLTVKDMKSRPPVGVTVVNELISDGAKFLMMPGDVDTALPGSIVAQRKSIPFMTVLAGDASYRERAGRYAFLNGPGTLAEGAAQAEYAYAQGHRTAYMVTSNDIGFTSSISQAFEERFNQLGGKVIGTTLFHIDDTQFEATATRAVHADADVLISQTFMPTTVSFLRALDAAGNDKPIILNEGSDQSSIFESGPQLANTTVVSYGYYRGPASVTKQFQNAYRKRYDELPPSHSEIQAGNAIYTLATAVKKAGSDDPERVYDALNTLVEVPGVTGLITYKGAEGVQRSSFGIFEFDVAKKEKKLVKLLTPEVVPDG